MSEKESTQITTSPLSWSQRVWKREVEADEGDVSGSATISLTGAACGLVNLAEVWNRGRGRR